VPSLVLRTPITPRTDPISRIGGDHRTSARVDAVWLAGVVTELEQCAELAERLPVVVNNVATVRDGRLVVGLRQDPAPTLRYPGMCAFNTFNKSEWRGSCA
jgi:Lantibiotic dehydratase, N terminus